MKTGAGSPSVVSDAAPTRQGGGPGLPQCFAIALIKELLPVPAFPITAKQGYVSVKRGSVFGGFFINAKGGGDSFINCSFLAFSAAAQSSFSKASTLACHSLVFSAANSGSS